LDSALVLARPKRRERRKAEEFQVERLLALAELRYLEDVRKLQTAIGRNKRLWTVGLVGTVAKVRLRLTRCHPIVQRTFLLKWRDKVQELAGSKEARARIISLAYSLRVLGQVTQRLVQRAFLIFQERGLTAALLRQVQPEHTKLSKYVPPPADSVSNQQLLRSLGLGEPGTEPQALGLDEGTRLEFRKALRQGRYQERTVRTGGRGKWDKVV